MAAIADESVDLIVADPPYYKTAGEWWDYQWRSPDDYLEWLGAIADGWERILKKTGSVYCFASPQMAARVEVMLRDRFDILNHIVWSKPEGTGALKYGSENLRRYVQKSERIIFCEKKTGFDPDGFPYEALYAYMEGERVRSGARKRDINKLLGFRESGGMAGRKYFSRSEFCLPKPEHYRAMRAAYPGFWEKPHEDLVAEFQATRRTFEETAEKRPFYINRDVAHSDVWEFPKVKPSERIHPCEKPAEMMRHIVRASSRPGDLVLDCFAGSGVTSATAKSEGRRWLGIEIDPEVAAIAHQRVVEKGAARQLNLLEGVS